MTKLNDNQIEILKRARENLQENANRKGYIYEFLCHQVIFADLGIKEFPKHSGFGDLVSQCSQDAQALVSAIASAIKGSISLELYIDRHAKVDYRKFSMLARLAWLDKMIESGVCA